MAAALAGVSQETPAMIAYTVRDAGEESYWTASAPPFAQRIQVWSC
jgi:hypothetical protein